MCHTLICLKQKKVFFFFIFLTPFLAFFSTLPSTQTIKVIGLIFLSDPQLANWAMHMHFNTIPILLDIFLGGGGQTPPPRLYIDADLPAFIGLKFAFIKLFNNDPKTIVTTCSFFHCFSIVFVSFFNISSARIKFWLLIWLKELLMIRIKNRKYLLFLYYTVCQILTLQAHPYL